MTDFIYIIQALPVVLLIFIITLVTSISIALYLVYIRWTKAKIFQDIILGYTWIFRGTPLMLQLFFIYYGLPIAFKINLSPLVSVFLAFSINYTAYFIVIFSDGFFTLSKGQVEAGFALGLSKTLIFKKILRPQAIRQTLGSLSSESLNLVKDTALISTIGMSDILRSSKEIVSRDFTIVPFFYAFMIYLVLSFLIVRLFKYIATLYHFDLD